MSLIVKFIIALAAIGGAGWGYANYYAAPRSTADAPAQPTQEQAQAAQQPQAAQAADASAQITARGSSDASLDADLADIDAQLQAAAQSSAAADKGMNDKAGDVTY